MEKLKSKTVFASICSQRLKGAVLSSTQSSESHKTGEWKTQKPKVIIEKCNSCGICWQYCPDMAIKKMPNGKYEIDYDYCKGCLICMQECPSKAIEKEKD